MIVRTYAAGDLEKCTELFVRVFNGEPWNDKWSREGAEKYLKDYADAPGFRGFVVEEKSDVNAFIFGVCKKWWSGSEFFIYEMCVQTGLQRSGLGTALMSELEARLKDEGIERLTLLTERGIPAEGFYKKNGFEGVERLTFMCKEIR